MKKIYILSSAILLFFSLSRAQGGERGITMGVTMLEDSIKFGAPVALTEIIITASVTNYSASPINVACTRTVNDTAAGWKTYFCLVECQIPNTAYYVATIDPDTNVELSFHFVVTNLADTSWARMKLRCVESSEEWYHWFEGITLDGFVGVNDPIIQPTITVSPSPLQAGSPMIFTIPASIENGDIQILDLNGRLVKYMPFNQAGKQYLNTEGMNPGLYLYKVNGNGNIPSTGKVIIFD